MNKNRKTIIRNLQEILQSVKHGITEQNFCDATELIVHDEWGEALDLICTQVIEYDVRLPERVYLLIHETCGLMEIDPVYCSQLKSLVDKQP
jgi:hypothetical protein